MKATELMIGDWYYDTDLQKNRKFHQLQFAEAYGDPTYELKIEPIPLIAEILEKNGWKKAQFWHEYQDGKNTIQSCLPDMRGIFNGVEIQHFKCEYVHQYQHLLRLCGLTELADNFKV